MRGSRLVAALALAGCTRSAPTTSSTAPTVEPPPPAAPAASSAAPPDEAGECARLFEPPAGVEELCDEHVITAPGAGGEIHWRSYATGASRFEVFDPYRALASKCGAGAVWKPPITSIAKGQKRLSVHDAHAGDYPSCDRKPSADKKTVIVISTKMDR